MRRAAATLSVAALLVVAGCSAGGDTTKPEYDTDAEPLYETPLDEEAVLTAHLDVLRERETFTAAVNWTLAHRNGPNQTRQRTVWVNLDRGTVYEHQRSQGGVQQTYRLANGTAYYRTVDEGEVSYGQVPGSVRNATSYARGNLPIVLDAFAFSYAGTTTRGGDSVHVYESDGMNEDRRFWAADNLTVTDANATLYVREDGAVVRSNFAVRFERDGTRVFLSVDRRVGDVGDTDASAPGWIPAARNATD